MFGTLKAVASAIKVAPARRGFASYADNAWQAACKWPSTKVTTLSNGIRVATEELPTQSATVGVWTDTGSRYELSDGNGVAHFLEHMFFKGTNKRSKVQLEQEIENMGAHLNAYTSRESTIFYAKVFKNDVNRGLEVLSDILQNSVFDPQAIEDEKHTILREMQEVEQQTEEVVFDFLHETAYRGTPLNRTILGSADDITSMTQAKLLDYYRTMFVANRMVVCGVGAINHEKFVDSVAKLFSAIPTKSQSGREPVLVPARFTGSDIRVRYDSMEKCHVALAFPTAGWTDADNSSLMVIQGLIGSYNKAQGSSGKYSSSSLIRKLHSSGLAESIHPFNTQYSDTGLFGIYGVADKYTVNDYVDNMVRVFPMLAHDVDEGHLLEAKHNIVSSLLNTLESSSSIAEDVGRHLLSYGRRIHPAEMVSRVMAVTEKDVKSTAERFFYDRDFAMAAVGNTWELPDYNFIRQRTFSMKY